jgi:tRNA-splicing ligase RtcB
VTAEPVIFGTHQANTLAQFADVAKGAVHAALMSDGHLGYICPVGGVVAYRNQVSLAAVGFDIACGNCAIETDLPAAAADRSWLAAVADEIHGRISFGIGRKNSSMDAPTDHPLFADPAWEGIPAQAREALRDKARAQLGTVGSGNHYVDVFAGDGPHGRLWVGVHFGSRGFGHTIASGFLALAAGAQWGARVPETEVLLDLDSPLGHDYYQLMLLAGRYAYAGREWVARKVVEILGGGETLVVHNHHNWAWKERHFGEELVVARKGATPAFPGQLGFVGGSMGDCSVILRGRPLEEGAPEGTQEQQAALFSTVHGAGRVMSRTEAAGKRNRKTGELKKAGKVSPEMMAEWLDREGVILRGGGLDESPHAYRRLPEVIAAQGRTIEVVETLRPLVVVMAGADELDPYRD